MASWGAEQQKKARMVFIVSRLRPSNPVLSPVILSLEQGLGWGSQLAVGCGDH